MKQRILALLLAAGLCLGLIAAAPALAFSDVSGEELSEAVEVLSGLGIVSGYSDGSYHPDDALTRAQFCKLAILTEGHGDQAQGSAYRTRFSDVPGGGWAAPYINLACEEGLFAGYGDGRFGPDDPVTVGQAVTVVLRLLGYTAEEIGPFWPEDYLNKAGALGLLDVAPARRRSQLLRDAALLLYRVFANDRPGRTGLHRQPLRLQGNRRGLCLDNNARQQTAPIGTVKSMPIRRLAGMSLRRRCRIAWWGGKARCCWTRRERRWASCRTTCPIAPSARRRWRRTASPPPEGERMPSPAEPGSLLDVWSASDCWYELEGREQVTLYYTDSGALDLVVASEAAA